LLHNKGMQKQKLQENVPARNLPIRAEIAKVEKLAQFNNILIDAARQGNVKEVERLLEAGADVNATNERGETVLMRAAEHGQTEACAFLIAKGADVNAKIEKTRGWAGWTALMRAARNGRTRTCALLIGNCADMGAKAENGDYAGETALTLAVRGVNNSAEAEQFLRSLEKMQELIGADVVRSFLKPFRECVAA
jgi:ankyrin repeat protein